MNRIFGGFEELQTWPMRQLDTISDSPIGGGDRNRHLQIPCEVTLHGTRQGIPMKVRPLCGTAGEVHSTSRQKPDYLNEKGASTKVPAFPGGLPAPALECQPIFGEHFAVLGYAARI
jgi:hypothetical protein